MKRFNVVIILSGLAFMAACKEKDKLTYVDSNAPAPAQVSAVSAINIPGGAKITYKVPSDYNLLYVKAVYERHPGELTEAKTSVFNDTLIVEGFADTAVHEVKLYSVGKNKKESEPLSVQVKPGTPPHWTAFDQSSMKETFGGAVVTFNNPDEVDLAYVLIVDTTGNGDWTDAETFYTKLPGGVFSARGYDTIPYNWGLYVRDRWGHKSDTLLKTLTPIFETRIDRALFREVSLPTDNNAGHSWSGVGTRAMTFLWNNTWNSSNDCFHTKTGTPQMPQWFTFDLGRSTVLSRMKFFHRAGAQGAYLGGDPKVIEIWGSEDPNPDGSWESWTLLATFRSIKPSPDPKVVQADLDFGVINGEDFEFPPGVPRTRYIRWKTLETWGGFQYMYISELQFWGSR